jgi:hypothetical protein
VNIRHSDSGIHSMHRAIIALVFFASVDSSSGAARDSQLLNIARSRTQITSGELELRIHYGTFKTIPRIAGGDCTVHFWFESDGKAFRLDFDDTKRQVDGLPGRYRYAYDGASYRLIDFLDEAKYPLQEFTKAKPKTAKKTFDARILGIYPSTFLGLHNYSLNDVERIVTNAATWSREEKSDGFSETYDHKKGMTYRFYYSKNGLPIRYEFSDAQAARPYRYGGSVEYDLRRLESFSLPSKVSFRRYEAETLTIEEDWEVTVIQLNQPIDRSICSWAALSPKLGTRLVVDRQEEPGISTVWDGTGFRRVVARPAGAQAGNAANSRVVVYLIVNVIIVMVLAYRWVWKRGHSASTELR